MLGNGCTSPPPARLFHFFRVFARYSRFFHIPALRLGYGLLSSRNPVNCRAAVLTRLEIMNCSANILVGLLLAVSTYPAQADAIVEGVVRLPKATPTVPNTARYQNTIQGEVGPPDPPLAVVYLEGNFPVASTTNPPSVRMEQKHYQFAPGILPVQKGTSVEFPNLDDAYHNVFSYSKAKRFDLGRYRKDEKPAALTFDKPGVVKLYCEIHEHMRGIILVLDTPYFVKTDTAGKYRLAHLPPGKYTLNAWLSEKTVFAKTVELKDGEIIKVDFPSN